METAFVGPGLAMQRAETGRALNSIRARGPGRAVRSTGRAGPTKSGPCRPLVQVPDGANIRSTAQGLPEPLSLRGSTPLPEQLNMKAVTGACKLIDGCSSLELCLVTPSMASSSIFDGNKVNSIA